MTASLPWYDLPELRHATNALWRELARQFRRVGLTDVPDRLNRRIAYERQWTSSDFLFGQACGYDVRLAYPEHLQIVATPCYAVPGCSGSNYSSLVVVREDSAFDSVTDLRGTRCVINTPTSHSGMNVLRALVAPLHCDGHFFSEVHRSGSHERSVRMILQRAVDVAAIDCVTFELLRSCRPHEVQKLRVLHRTEHVPAPPYVTASSTTPEMLSRMREALRQVFSEPRTIPMKKQLLLADVQVLPDESYLPIETLEVMAHNCNYREIPGGLLAAGNSATRSDHTL